MTISFTLKPTAPFRLDYTVWALRRRSKNLVDRWDGQFYTRLFLIENDPVKVTIEQKNSGKNPEILVSINKSLSHLTQIKIKNLLEKMLGLQQNLEDFYQIANQDSQLNTLVDQFMGLKPPRFPSLFEALTNAISCQQISLDAGLQIQNRLIEHVGIKLGDSDGGYYAFPRPQEVADCTLTALKKIGYSTSKSQTLIRLASAINEHQTMFDHLDNLPNEEIISFLCKFKGIGRWTAEYVLLRGLGRTDVFPGDDIGAQNNLRKLLHLHEKLDYKKIQKITGAWDPYAGLVYFHLLLQRLSEQGVIQNDNH